MLKKTGEENSVKIENYVQKLKEVSMAHGVFLHRFLVG